MSSLFVAKLALSFLVGSAWVTLGTVAAERYGSRVGGFMAGLPTTILISLFFIGWTTSLETAVAATTIVPAIGGINCLFLVVYILLVQVSFWLALGGALIVWVVCSGSLVAAGFNSFTLSLAIYVVLLVGCYYVAEKRLGIPSEASRPMRYTASMVLFRGCLAGGIIALAVVLARFGGPLLGGMFAMFPAMFLGTLLITYFAHGAGFSAAVMKASILSAISVVVYGVAVRYTYLTLGLWAGTLASLVIAYAAAMIVYQSLTRRLV
jgi:uncharacterized membrane protein (GlpM family)